MIYVELHGTVCGIGRGKKCYQLCTHSRIGAPSSLPQGIPELVQIFAARLGGYEFEVTEGLFLKYTEERELGMRTW